MLRLNVPVNIFFSYAGSEPTLPVFNQYFRELMRLAQGHNTVTPVCIEPRTLDSESDALPLDLFNYIIIFVILHTNN